MCGLFLLLFVFKLCDDTQMRFLSMKKSRYFLGEFLMQKYTNYISSHFVTIRKILENPETLAALGFAGF